MITSIIKKVFNSKSNSHHKKLKEIRELPEDRAQRELGRLLFDICVENAIQFVTEEFYKEGSHFRNLDKHKLFHEILAINFWLVDKKFSKLNKSLLDEMHNLYSVSYGEAAGLHAAADSLRDKYRVYHDSWNDVTGYQDQFGLKATEFIFGDADAVPVEQTSFWIISHADDALKTFSDIKKKCRIAGRGKQ